MLHDTSTFVPLFLVLAVAASAAACEGGNGAAASGPHGAPPQGAPPALHAPTCEVGVFRSVDEAAAPSGDAATVRERLVGLDLPRLRSMPTQLALNLFDDVCLIAVRQAELEGNTPVPVWMGRIEGVPNSQVTMVLNDDVLSASISSPPSSYQVELVRGDTYRVREVDASKYPNELPSPEPPPALAPPPGPSPGLPPSAAPSGSGEPAGSEPPAGGGPPSTPPSVTAAPSPTSPPPPSPPPPPKKKKP